MSTPTPRKNCFLRSYDFSSAMFFLSSCVYAPPIAIPHHEKVFCFAQTVKKEFHRYVSIILWANNIIIDYYNIYNICLYIIYIILLLIIVQWANNATSQRSSPIQPHQLKCNVSGWGRNPMVDRIRDSPPGGRIHDTGKFPHRYAS